MERSDAGSKKCKRNEVKLVNPNILRFSCVSWIDDGDIPEWLLVEVLIRLPVKFVFRFKLVSKKWLSVISDPYFVRVCVSRASSLSQQPWTIVPRRMLHKDSQFSHLDYELLKDSYVKPSLCVVGLPSIHQPQEEENYLIYGVSNGLVLYRLYKRIRFASVDHNYYICNPLSGHCIALPTLQSKVEWCGWGFHTHVEDGFLKSYRVVGIQSRISRSDTLKFQVYFSEIGEWKDFTIPCNLFPLCIHKVSAAVLNGILHWIAEGHGIIAYDPYHNPENMRIIAFPGDRGGGGFDFNSLCDEYRGQLRYFEMYGWITSGIAFPSYKVWVLNDYSSGDWCLQYDIGRVDFPYDVNFPELSIGPMCSHPFDSDIMYLGCGDGCLSYNIKTRKVQGEDEFFRHSENVFKKGPHWWMDFLLFVIPHWPISLCRPSHGAKEG